MTILAFRTISEIWETIGNNMPFETKTVNESDSPCQTSPCGDGEAKCCSNIIGAVPDSCPCCKRQMKDERQVVGETRFQMKSHDSLFSDDASDTDSSIDDMDEDDKMMPGLLADGIQYTIKQVLVQGWVHKKGTGMDWFGSRAWKPRWAVLALGRISGHNADVPLLQIYWYPNSPSPSTVIHLDSAVVLPEEDPDLTKWNCYRFKIRHVKKSVDESSVQITRYFSCPREGRDSWLYAINQALLEYEKSKASSRSLSSNLCLSPPSKYYRSWERQDSFPTGLTNKPTLPSSPPPLSPRSRSMKLPLPPSETLIGEAFLADDW